MRDYVPEVCEGSGFDLTLSFSAAGWLQMYHFGAAQAMLDSQLIGKALSEGKRIRFCGCSAGSIVAVLLASKRWCFEDIREKVITYGEHYRSSWLHLLSVANYLNDSFRLFSNHMRDIENNAELYRIFNDGSLEIYVTNLSRCKQKVMRTFKNYDDVVESILASCCMVPLVGVPFRLKSTGEWVCDGALANVTPRLGEARTITVSPFYCSAATIHPSVFVPINWGLRPPDEASHRSLFDLGYNDAIKGLVSNGYITEQEGESLLKPDTSGCFKGIGKIGLFDSYVGRFILILVRCAACWFIYAELCFMCFVYFVRYLLNFELTPLSNMCENIVNMLSLQTLKRVIFRGEISDKDKHLSKCSFVFRVLHPIILE
uniref:PNPLA domain-containing protein n=1 Tax=Trypanosoma congolense (strain IL3000) TaxID=1068625 RepID=G0UL03_TRYCI|nr:conserved hypothetical protein [Trypanosoma congolense IL3000]